MSYKDLIFWQKAMDLATEIYRLTKNLPQDELYGLTNQMRRAAVSIPSNIAEANESSSASESLKFLSVSSSSNAEVETQLLLCVKLNYLTQEDIKAALSLSNETGRMLTSTIKKIREKESLTAD